MNARDPRISEIFYYFESHTDIATGRTVGRKIGVIQEIIIKKLLLTEPSIRDCLIYEPRLRGKSGATHKVEFVLFKPLVVALIGNGEKLRMQDPSLEITIRRVDLERGRASIAVLTGDGRSTRMLSTEQAVPVSIVSSGRARTLFLKLVEVSNGHCRVAVLDSEVPLASLESKRVGAQRFSGSDALGSGIQTIEKAKQTSLVAIDFDLQFNDTLLSKTAADSPRQFRSFALLGNGVHWTDHDLSVLQTYVDFTFQVKDDAIIRYAEFVRVLAEAAGEPFLRFFMSYFDGMTKTPLDAFQVFPSDFVLLRPRVAPYVGMTLTELVRQQLPPYAVAAKEQ